MHSPRDDFDDAPSALSLVGWLVGAVVWSGVLAIVLAAKVVRDRREHRA